MVRSEEDSVSGRLGKKEWQNRRRRGRRADFKVKSRNWKANVLMFDDDGIRKLRALGSAVRLRMRLDSGNADTGKPVNDLGTGPTGSELVGRDLGGVQCLQ
ncbi:hypothetical protein CGRA01v4_04081 [Colletotrichum graminicola]|uniref:Uncharacterized protein n=1 Tax=Colletotrichum graminicola (strain M1.001 / M2 / FGSC 10212) TaxID=645133 RepID=E3QXM0_COLGM|nr:uncharacterized protein GLRG_10752 [Colletotrichum graminicola M1.001]EFQ35608.1 hypothetical protein GLRG_10752 [Colletotrichum graminicola M1.001]WDK12800.1 hypothetical protein CGRA01v4_04081 [Colletotrichum graminicola]